MFERFPGDVRIIATEHSGKVASSLGETTIEPEHIFIAAAFRDAELVVAAKRAQAREIAARNLSDPISGGIAKLPHSGSAKELIRESERTALLSGRNSVCVRDILVTAVSHPNFADRIRSRSPHFEALWKHAALQIERVSDESVATGAESEASQLVPLLLKISRQLDEIIAKLDAR